MRDIEKCKAVYNFKVIKTFTSLRCIKSPRTSETCELVCPILESKRRANPFERKSAFTLAEVLITLGIIGVVAAMTLPNLVQNYQKKVLQNQFKKAYSLLSQTLRKSEADLDFKPDCFYWEIGQSPYAGMYYCEEYSPVNGACIRYNKPLPADNNGPMGECTLLRDAMEKNLNIIKVCDDKAYEKKCIPDYEGFDTAKENNNPDMSDYDLLKATAGCKNWNKQNLINSTRAIVLSDGTIILYYSGPQLLAVDVNGKKGPNKWGHDIFTFDIKSTPHSPLRLSPSTTCTEREKGGITTAQMLLDIYKK